MMTKSDLMCYVVIWIKLITTYGLLNLNNQKKKLQDIIMWSM